MRAKCANPPYALLTRPETENLLQQHRAHVMIMAPRDPESMAEAVAEARAVTVLAYAAAKLTGGQGVKWLAANNTVPIRLLDAFSTRFLPQGRMATPLWVRLLCGGGPADDAGRPSMVAATLGFWQFKRPEVEFELRGHARENAIPFIHATCEYLLSLDESIKSGEKLHFDGGIQFDVTTQTSGTFDGRPVIRCVQI